jgi:hypothetical protein
MARPNCYACEFRTGIPGDAHSECRHPGATLIRGVAFLGAALGTSDKEHRDFVMDAEATPEHPAIRVAFAAHGIRNGWVTWPLNYDPTWLRECTGFTPKEGSQDASE